MKKFNNHPNLVGELIKNARKKKNFTKVDLCRELELLGIAMSRNEIYRIEKNQMIVKDFELVAIAKLLDIDLNIFKNQIES